MCFLGLGQRIFAGITESFSVFMKKPIVYQQGELGRKRLLCFSGYKRVGFLGFFMSVSLSRYNYLARTLGREVENFPQFDIQCS